MKLYSRLVFFCVALLVLTGNSLIVHGQQGLVADNPTALLRVGDKVIKVNDAISMVEGFGNTFMVTTPEGNVIIDTSIAGRNHEGVAEALHHADSIVYLDH